MRAASKPLIHHDRPISMGGTNKFKNLVLIDPEFHEQIHKKINLTTRAINDCKKRLGKKKKEMLGAELAKIDIQLRKKHRPWAKIPYPDGPYCIPQLVLYAGQNTAAEEAAGRKILRLVHSRPTMGAERLQGAEAGFV